MAETVTVVGESPIVDVESSSVRTSFKNELVSELPTNRNFYDFVQLAPGMSARLLPARRLGSHRRLRLQPAVELLEHQRHRDLGARDRIFLDGRQPRRHRGSRDPRRRCSGGVRQRDRRRLQRRDEEGRRLLQRRRQLLRSVGRPDRPERLGQRARGPRLRAFPVQARQLLRPDHASRRTDRQGSGVVLRFRPDQSGQGLAAWRRLVRLRLGHVQGRENRREGHDEARRSQRARRHVPRGRLGLHLRGERLHDQTPRPTWSGDGHTATART